MKARDGILAAGNWIVDQLKTVDQFPQQDALANILEESVGNGGSPFNVLVNLARIGAAFPLAGWGLTGDDAAGRWVRERCAAHGIVTDRLGAHAHAPTSYTDVMTVQSTGRRTFFHQRGANAFLTADHFDFADVRAKIFHLGYLLLLDALDAPDAEFGTVAARVLDRAGAAGCKTSVDVVSEDGDRFASVVLPALRHVDYCVLNEFELERTTGIGLRGSEAVDPDALVPAMRRLLDAGVWEWVVVHYPAGACALGREGGLYSQGSVRLPAGEIVGTAGAGDAFAAGLLHGLHEETDIATAMRYGVCVAAASLRDISCSDGVPPLVDCLELGNKYGFRA